MQLIETVADLALAMQNKLLVALRKGDSNELVTGIVCCFETEDGSGFNYNVSLHNGGKAFCVFTKLK